MPITEEERMRTAEQFYQKARFPRVIGAIDCTHVRLAKSPGAFCIRICVFQCFYVFVSFHTGGQVDDPENYRNRKGFFSINVQVCVCGFL